MNLLMKDGDGEVVSGYPLCVLVEIRITIPPDVCCMSLLARHLQGIYL